MTSNRHVVLWIDHSEARIFHVDAENNHPDDAHRYFREVARALEGAERVLVVGPSTAKLQFIRYAYKHDRTLEPRIAGVETVDHPTDGQLLAYAKRYFAADDRMQGG